MPYIPPSIRTTGLLKHLDNTANEHNSYTGKDFDKMKRSGAGMASISRIFGVAGHTGRKWERIYFDEGHGDDAWRDHYATKHKLDIIG